MKIGKKQYPVLEYIVKNRQFNLHPEDKIKFTIANPNTHNLSDYEVKKYFNNHVINTPNKNSYSVIYCSNQFTNDAGINFHKIRDYKVTPGVYVLLRKRNPPKSLDTKLAKQGFVGRYELIVAEFFENISHNIEMSFVSFVEGALGLIGVLKCDKEGDKVDFLVNNVAAIREDGKAMSSGNVHYAWNFGVWIKGALLFKQFADFKTKKLPPKSKSRNFHCRWKNEFDIKIELCDTNWYTQSIQGHPFVVRGHWRMQAHGSGMRERKLIWIDEFMKQGYKKGAYKDK